MAKTDTQQSKNPKLESIKMAMEQIEKQYGKGSIMKMGDARKSFEMDVVPTGSIALDLALGVGGFPRGRIVEIFGPEASGKTSIALSVIAQAQARGGTAAFIDAEHALDPIWAEKLGVKLDDLLISQPDNGEQALEITETLIRSGGIDVLVVDSVAALVPKSEIEGEMGDSVMGLQARLMSQALRKLTGVISRSKTVTIFTNQLRQKIGIMFGNPETTPGGLAMKFYASIRLDSRKIETLKDGDKVIGSRHRIRVVKNKVAPPFRIAEIDVMENGISKSAGLIDVGVETGVVGKSGAFYKYQGQMLGQGREAAKMELDKNKELAKKIEAEILKRAKTDKLPVKLGEDEESTTIQ